MLHGNMDEVMEFPKTVEEFMEQYKVVDTENVYSNGAEFVPIFRMKQWLEHTAEKTGKWIPVSERLPDEEKGTYWVCTDTEYQCECRWTNVNHFWTELTTNWHWHIMDIPQYTKVIAWMPLPEPYKEANK